MELSELEEGKRPNPSKAYVERKGEGKSTIFARCGRNERG